MSANTRYSQTHPLTPTCENQQQNGEIATNFTPTPRMLAVLDWFQEHDYLLRTRRVFDLHGTASDRVEWYRWHKSVPGFSRWWLEQAELHHSRALPRVHGRMIAAAVSKAGVAADRKLVCERFDEGYRAKDDAAPPPATIRIDVLGVLRAMIEGVSQAVPRGASCFAAPLGALPMIEGQAVKSQEDSAQ